MSDVMERLVVAINAHDLDGFVACFAPSYRSVQPAHPDRTFEGSDKIRENWTSVFSGVPDLSAELLVSTTTGDGIEFGEWRWWGTYRDGSPFDMRGVTVMGIEGAQITWGRLYMEAVERDGVDIDQMVSQAYRPVKDEAPKD